MRAVLEAGMARPIFNSLALALGGTALALIFQKNLIAGLGGASRES